MEPSDCIYAYHIHSGTWVSFANRHTTKAITAETGTATTGHETGREEALAHAQVVGCCDTIRNPGGSVVLYCSCRTSAATWQPANGSTVLDRRGGGDGRVARRASSLPPLAFTRRSLCARGTIGPLPRRRPPWPLPCPHTTSRSTVALLEPSLPLEHQRRRRKHLLHRPTALGTVLYTSLFPTTIRLGLVPSTVHRFSVSSTLRPTIPVDRRLSFPLRFGALCLFRRV